MSSPSSPESDVRFAATVLAVRTVHAQQCGGLVKQGDWQENLQKLLSRLAHPNVNLAQSFRGNPAAGIAADPTGAAHWKNVGLEALRNAIIGAGVGGVGGAATSLFDRERKKQPLNRALRGALIGAALGGLGTGAYRGAEYAMSDVPSETIETEVGARRQAVGEYTRLKAQGYAVPDTVEEFVEQRAPQIAKQRNAVAAGAPAPSLPQAPERATPPTGPRPGVLESVGERFRGAGSALGGYMDEDLTAGQAAGEAARSLWGTPETRVTPLPLGAAGGGYLGWRLRNFPRGVYNRWNLFSHAHHPEFKAKGLTSTVPAKTPVRLFNPLSWPGIRRLRYGGQIQGMTAEQARAGTQSRAKALGMKPGKLRTPLGLALALGLSVVGSEADRRAAEALYGQPQPPSSP